MAIGYMGSSASGKSCICEPKVKNNWEIVGYAGKKTVIYCWKCRHQWKTNAKYIEELRKD